MQPPTNIYPEISPDLNVAAIGVVEGAAGPGRRLVVWVQGCGKRCPGCLNGPYLDYRIARRVPVRELLAMLRGDRTCIGLTLSGGEPFLQAEALLPLLVGVRDSGLTTVCYTGYTREELAGPVVERFLALTNLLIDGEYQGELARGGVYRPSANQRLHFISGNILPSDCESVAETDVRLSPGGAAVGTLPAEVRMAIRKGLGRKGIHLKL